MAPPITLPVAHPKFLIFTILERKSLLPTRIQHRSRRKPIMSNRPGAARFSGITGDLPANNNLLPASNTVVTNNTTTLSNRATNLTLTGTADIDGTGNEANNVFTGNSGRNILISSSSRTFDPAKYTGLELNGRLQINKSVRPNPLTLPLP